jgi:hypothetical protein
VPDSESFTTTGLLAASADFLARAGYAPIPDEMLERFNSERARAFEDAYGVVLVVVYDTWDQLFTSWPDDQGALVDLLSAYVPREEAKAWEGYLVLLTPGGDSEEAQVEANQIRYNMTRVRKLVGIGSEMSTLADLERVLRPLLPIQIAPIAAQSQSVLDLLPDLLATESLPENMVREAIRAFLESRAIVEALHEVGSAS